MSDGANWPLTIFILLVVVAGIGWFASIIIRAVRDSNTRVEAQEAAHTSVPAGWKADIDTAGVDRPTKAQHVVLEDRSSVDVRDLPSVRMVIRGSGNYIGYGLHSAARDDSAEYILLREPGNRHDANAIAVHHPSGRKIGYVSRTRAEGMAPLLDQFGPNAFVVAGGFDDGRLRVDLPSIPALRSFVKRGGAALKKY